MAFIDRQAAPRYQRRFSNFSGRIVGPRRCLHRGFIGYRRAPECAKGESIAFMKTMFPG
ncbi:hypothetical protein [Salinicola salarius]|uniref:hypothetical protein n=1 Tax=Salinicola salarius TaxID=430457 RepID=UPI001ABFC197|nr:hypothetical protein [Salinicola salarius]